MILLNSFFEKIYFFLKVIWDGNEAWLSDYWRITILCVLVTTVVILIVMGYRHKLLKQESLNVSIQQETFNKQQKELATQKERALKQLEQRCEAIRHSSNIKQDLCWNNYERMCYIVNQNLNFLPNKIKAVGNFSEREIRLCILVALDFSYIDIANLLPYALSGVGKLKFSTAKKLGTSVRNMRKTLLRIAVLD